MNVPLVLHKRKYQEVDHSDDEDDGPFLGRQVLPVANLSADFKGKPKDGLQYLFTVRRDARMLPHITRAANPYEVREPREPLVDEMNASHPLLPSEEWREVFLKRFKNFRKNAVQPTLFAPLPASLGIMPRIRERDHWWAFLTGVPMSEWDAAKKPKPYQKPWRGQYHGYGADALPIPNAEGSSQTLSYSLEDGRVFSTSNSEMWRVTTDGVELTSAMNATASLPTPSGTPAPPDRPEDTSDQNAPASIYPEPTPKHMQLLFHGDALHLLMYFTHWIILHLERGSAPSPHILTDTHSRWIFALLSRVRDDVSADEMSTLRSLARACMSLIEERKRATSNVASSSQRKAVGLFPMNESGCWMIITLVIGIWGQRDLWQDAEAMLRRLPA